MKKIFIVLSTLLLPNQVIAQINYGDLLVSKIVKIFDGDTIYVDIEGVHPLLGSGIGVVLNDVDTPELDHRAKCDREKKLGQKAKAFVEQRLFNAEKIELRNVIRGRWFAINADIFYDGKDLGAELLRDTVPRARFPPLYLRQLQR